MEEKDILIEFLDLISEMVQSSYSNRISIDNAIVNIKKLKKDIKEQKQIK